MSDLEPREWQRLAWAIYAHDLATDEPDDIEGRDAAEAQFGAESRRFVALSDALTRIRGGAR